MFECSACGKTYKFQGGLNNHKGRCAGAAAGGAAPAPKYTKEDLENLQKQNQARLNTLIEAQKAANAAAAAANNGGGGGAAATPSATSTTTVVSNNTSNVGNEEHNASFNIKYVKRSAETQEVVNAIVAAANQYCKGRIIVTSDEPLPGCTSITGISTSVNDNGTTVYNYPTRTISIIETPPDEVSPEEEHDITLERMTYLIISLMQKNNKLTTENEMLRYIVSKIDPDSIE
jgi:hypothetical protein